jgi:DNA-binding transcriptional ArsR family regulator
MVAVTGKSVDLTLKALADPTRRRVIERLSRGTASVGELAEPFEMTLPSFVQHLKVLEDSGLVRSQKAGRVRTFELVPGRLRLAEDWLSKHRALWERRLDQLDDYLLTMKKETSDGNDARAQ